VTTTRHEVEVDTALAELWGEREALYRALDSTRTTIARMSGAQRANTRQGGYLGNHAEWTTALEAKLPGMTPWDERSAMSALTKQDELVNQVKLVTEKIAPLEAEFNAAPWSRFFLVQNHGGHIHSSMRCSTCFVTTSFGWLPTLSGLTEKDAVDEHGTILCSVCFPSAPVEWTVGKSATADPDTCPGTGTGDWVEGSYKSYWNGGGRAQCKHCERSVSVTTAHNIRKHKKEKS
jgi:hypothetical protein